MPGQSQRWKTRNGLEEHVRLMRKQIAVSLDDSATHMLSSAIVAGNFDNVIDPRTGQGVPAVPFHGRWYRGAQSWADARDLCEMRDSACEATALWNFATLNLRYGGDQDGEDTYKSVRASLESGTIDCDDFCIFFASMFKAIGYENVIARIASIEGRTWDHVWTLVQLPRRGRSATWISLDPTEPGKNLGWSFTEAAAIRDFAL